MPKRDPDLTSLSCRIDSEPPIEARNGAYCCCKIVLDFVAALMVLVLTAPLILLVVVVVKWTSRGPAFYCHERLGKNGRLFTLYKMRTMVDNAEAETGPIWAEPHDVRITPVGRLLRQFHIDELPQLFNVLRGDMSMVGPRPERPELVTSFEWDVPHYHERLQVRPGLTGFAQLRLPPDTDTDCVRRKLVYDLYYVQRYSFSLDLQILFLTCLQFASAFIKPVPAFVDLPDWNTVCDKLSMCDKTSISGGRAADAPDDPEWYQNSLPASSTVSETEEGIVS